jgi:hypothetical protein
MENQRLTIFRESSHCAMRMSQLGLIEFWFVQLLATPLFVNRGLRATSIGASGDDTNNRQE